MADEMLDYGDPVEGGVPADSMLTGVPSAAHEAAYSGASDQPSWDLNPRLAPQEVFAEDDEMDEGEEIDDDERQRRKTAREAERKGTRFYPLPAEEGVRAGASRGIAPEPLNADDLMGDADDAPTPEVPMPIGGGTDIRYAVLHISGTPITQCSTSRLFAYITHYGAQPLGLEWINDQSCNVVFADPEAARLAIEYLCPAIPISTQPLLPLPSSDELVKAVDKKLEHDRGNEIPEWPQSFLESLLLPRKAHRFPAVLYGGQERDAAREWKTVTQGAQGGDDHGEANTLPEDVPEIYREMEEEDRRKKWEKPEFRALKNLRGTLWVRWALESADVKANRAAKQSKWYREHGLDAGRDVVPNLLRVGASDERQELFPTSTPTDKEEDQKQDIAGLPERPQWDAINKRGRGHHGRGIAAMDELDDDLDNMTSSRTEGQGRHPFDDRYERYPQQQHRRGRGTGQNRRDTATMGSLDEELETIRRDRSASPGAGGGRDYHHSARGDTRTEEHFSPSSSVRVRGRGSMRAPRTSVWDDDEHEDGYGYGSPSAGAGRSLQDRLRGGLVSDELERKAAMRGGRRRRDRGGFDHRWENRDPRSENTETKLQVPTLEERLRTGDSYRDGNLSDRLG